MNREAMSRCAGLVAGVALLQACGGTSSPAAQAQVQAGPKPAVHTFAGGCAGTVLTDAEPPMWAQAGWTHPKGTSWDVPWALGSQNASVAYVFAGQLVAGPSPRVNGTNNKILWVGEDHPFGDVATIEGHPLGQSQPVVTIVGGPSITDVPTAGCWTFQLSWKANGKQSTSTINLEVLPTGS
jgi:hypothetical protein